MTRDQLIDKQYQNTIEQLGDFLLDSYIKSKENGINKYFPYGIKRNTLYKGIERSTSD
jgi:hypothetical protein